MLAPVRRRLVTQRAVGCSIGVCNIETLDFVPGENGKMIARKGRQGWREGGGAREREGKEGWALTLTSEVPMTATAILMSPINSDMM